MDIRDVLDWSYYIERLGGTIQKIITIPAAMQGVANPVPRVRHPNWLHKKMLEKSDNFKQKRITDMFKFTAKPSTSSSMDVDENSDNDENNRNETNVDTELPDIEEVGTSRGVLLKKPIAVVTKRKRGLEKGQEFTEEELNKSWREVLGNPPPYTKVITANICKFLVLCPFLR